MISTFIWVPYSYHLFPMLPPPLVICHNLVPTSPFSFGIYNPHNLVLISTSFDSSTPIFCFPLSSIWISCPYHLVQNGLHIFVPIPQSFNPTTPIHLVSILPSFESLAAKVYGYPWLWTPDLENSRCLSLTEIWGCAFVLASIKHNRIAHVRHEEVEQYYRLLN